jgi:small subunit ribosomal protein S4
MARYTGPVCRLCRRENAKLFLKGDRCYTQKCSFTKRPTPPGQHGLTKSKISGYGVQLREKQKVKRAYGVLESQFRKYFVMAEHMKGITGENLLQLLERRLDNVVYRMGFADSRPQARQLVLHEHFTVSGKKVNIPSYLVAVDEIVQVKESSRQMELFKSLKDSGKTTPSWIDVNLDALNGRITALPKREDIDLILQEHLIVELYSR